MASGTLKKDVILNLEINDQEAVNNIAALTRHLDELKAKQIVLNEQQVKLVEDLNKKLKEGKITEEEYAAALQKKYVEIAKNDAAIKETKRSISAYQKELQNNLVAEKAEKNSLDAMRAQLLNMKKAYDALSEVERNTDDGQKRQKNIEELTQKIKDLEAAQLDFRRNVGNYPQTTQNAKQALKEMTVECQNLAVALAQSEGNIQAQNTLLQTLATTLGTDSQEYKDAANELQRMNAEYASSKEKLNELTVEAGKLRDTIGDVNQNINSFANDQQKIAAMQEGVGVLTSAYTILQGSMAALGIESKSLLEVYAKIQIVQQSVNSLMTIFKALNKDSNLMIVLRNKLEQARLVWTKAYNKALKEQNGELVRNTAAEAANATATTATTVAETAATTATFSLKAAFEALKATLLSNPFTAIALAITTVVVAIGSAISKIVKKNKEAKKSEEELAEAAKKTANEYKSAINKRVSAMNSAAKSYTEQIAKVKSLMSVVKSESAAYDAKKKAMDELNRLVPQYNGHLSKTGQIMSENSAAIDKYIKDLERQAEATASMNALISAFEAKIEAERKKRQNDSNEKYYQQQLDAAREMLNAQNSLDARFRDPQIMMTAQRNIDYYEKKLAAVRDEAKAINSELAESNKEIQYFSRHAKDLAITDNVGASAAQSAKNADDAVKRSQEQYDEMLKIAEDYYKELDKMATDSIQTLTEKENLRYQGERDQLQKALNNAQKLYDALSKDPKLLKELQKTNKYLSLETLGNQIKMLGEELDNVEKRHNDNLEKITSDTTTAFSNVMSKLRSDLDKASSDQTVKFTSELKSRLDALDDELKKELDAHEYTEEQKYEITKMYEQKKQQVVKDYTSTSSLGKYETINNINLLKTQLQQDLTALEAMKAAELSVFEGTEEEKAAIVKRYSDLRVQYEKSASQQEAKIWMQSTMLIADALSSAMGNMADLFSTLAEDDEKMNQYAKELAMGQIILSAAVATAQAVVAAINAGKDTGLGAAIAIPMFLVEFMGIVASVISQAKQTLSSATSTKPKFAEGGLVGTRTTRKKDDKIDAKLSEGEYVIKSEVVDRYGVKFFDFLNYGRRVSHSSKTSYAEGGQVVPQSVIQKTQTFSMDDFKEAMVEAISEMPNPVVSVKEITNTQKRVSVKESISKLK